MTITPCPHGCGGYLDTVRDKSCPACRRDPLAIELTVPEHLTEEQLDGTPFSTPTARKASWCWEWWGPRHHRMRCRLPKGHTGEHWDHEKRFGSTIEHLNNLEIAQGLVKRVSRDIELALKRK